MTAIANTISTTPAALIHGSITGFLLPVLILVVWTLIMWIWMYLTRIPAMQKAQINPDDARHPGTYSDRMPANVRAVADNYNHLHEAPTIFYALMFFAALTGGADTVAMYMAWTYVALRIIHSLVQILSPNVTLRFLIFSLSTFALMALAAKEVLRVLL